MTPFQRGERLLYANSGGKDVTVRYLAPGTAGDAVVKDARGTQFVVKESRLRRAASRPGGPRPEVLPAVIPELGIAGGHDLGGVSSQELIAELVLRGYGPKLSAPKPEPNPPRKK